MSHPAGRRLLALAALFFAYAAGAQPASFEGLGFLHNGSPMSLATAVSADGTIVAGTARLAGFVPVAFRWEDGVMESLGFLPGGTSSEAYGISGDGQVVVGQSVGNVDTEAFRWTRATGMEGLGDFPGGGFNSAAFDASTDGSVVVGRGTVEDGDGHTISVPFRWTAAGGRQRLEGFPAGIVGGLAYGVSGTGSVVVGDAHRLVEGGDAFRWSGGLGQLLGGTPGSAAHEVSTDGTTIVGVDSFVGQAFRWTQATGIMWLGAGVAFGVSADGAVVVGLGLGASPFAFIWTEEDGMRSLRDVLVEQGVDMTGWTLLQANAISADGRTVVGQARNAAGGVEAFRAVLGGHRWIAPATGDLVVSGQHTRLRWVAADSLGPLEILLLPDTLGAPRRSVTFGLPASDTAYTWAVPDSLYSRSARLVLRVMTDTTVADTSGFFRIKPYHLTRLTPDSARYDPYLPSRHGWSSANTEANWFPSTWYTLSQFDYRVGSDPFTQAGYDSDFLNPPIGAYVGGFPDWPAFVRAFGTDAAYSLIVPFVAGWYRPTFTAAWGSRLGPPGPTGTDFNGTYFGLSTASLMAFAYPEAFGTRYPAIGPVDRLFGVALSAAARETANELYSHQFGAVNIATTTAALRSTDPRRVLADLKTLFSQDEGTTSQRNLTIYNVTSCSPRTTNGAHTMTPYRLARDPSGPGRWRIYVYDSNAPGDDATSFVTIDSTANTWAFAGFTPAWGGACALILEDRIENYLGLAIPPAARESTRAGGGDSLFVSVAPAGDVRLAGAAGAVGYVGGETFNTLPGALPLIPKVGGVAAPEAYIVPAGDYRLTIENSISARQAAWFHDGESIYGYGRDDAEATHVDRVRYSPGDGGLAAASADAGVTKRITLRVVLPPGAEPERAMDAADLTLVGADSVGFAAVAHAAGPRLRLQNRGGAKTYTLRLLEVHPAGGARFRHLAVPLVAGATHVVRPDWAALGAAPVEVDVDLDGDGVPDEVLILENQPVANEPGVPHGSPLRLTLHPPAPNPAAGRATVAYELPAAGRVRLTVYDALGRQVIVLVDAERPAGRHEATLEAGSLAPGAYVLRLEAPAGVTTSRITVVR